ncbi:MAG: proton-conducting membrane transporter, partial [Clostridia bacterium]|nr:proton-conducting membrane transporter [Clostridia bacterium]
EKVFKKRLAYSTVSQVSYVLFGLSTMNAVGFVGAFMHIIFHSLIKNTLFMSAGAVIHKTGVTGVDDLRGMGRRMPVAMALFTVVSLGLIGIPPTGGFVSKWNLAMGAFSMTESFSWIGPVALLLSAILTAAYLLSVSIRSFFAGYADDSLTPCEPTWRMLVPMGLFAVLTVVLGICPGFISDYVLKIAELIF